MPCCWPRGVPCLSFPQCSRGCKLPLSPQRIPAGTPGSRGGKALALGTDPALPPPQPQSSPCARSGAGGSGPPPGRCADAGPGGGAGSAGACWQSFFFFQFHKTFPFLGAPGGFRLGSHVAPAPPATGCFPGRGDVSLATGRVPPALPWCCSRGSSWTPAAPVASCLSCGLAWRVPCLSFPIFGKAAPHPGGRWGHPQEAAEPHPQGYGQRRHLGKLRHRGETEAPGGNRGTGGKLRHWGDSREPVGRQRVAPGTLTPRTPSPAPPQLLGLPALAVPLLGAIPGASLLAPSPHPGRTAPVWGGFSKARDQQRRSLLEARARAGRPVAG